MSAVDRTIDILAATEEAPRRIRLGWASSCLGVATRRISSRKELKAKMEFIQIDQASTGPMFESMFRQRNLVPVLGAGFSEGQPTENGSVPNGDQFTKIMLTCLEANAGADAASLSGKAFSEIAEYFLNPEFVPTEKAKEVIKSNFIGVKLEVRRKAFLDCPWPYVYTLNIDDGVEGNSMFRNKVVPNRAISSTAKSLPCVYKVHGDATEELMYDEPSKIIFSTGQYVRSLSTNASMLNSLKTDLTEQNTLFVGCSLSNEIDLLFALAEYRGTFPEGRRSIYVTKGTLNRFEVAKLATHGINTVLQVNDYEAFYSQVATWGRQGSRTTGSLRKSFLVTPERQHRLGMDHSSNLSFLLRDPESRKSPGEVDLPAYQIRRDIEDAIIRVSATEPLVLVRGRRFSGRTLLLRSLAFAAKSKDVYFVESDTRVSDEVLRDLTDSENTLLLFDTNSLTADTAYSLAKAKGKLAEKHSSAIIAVNRTEPDIVGALVRQIDDKADFELDAKLSDIECKGLNRRMDSLGLLRFDCRRTLLENTFQVLAQYPERLSDLSRPRKLNEREVELLLVLAVADKAYSSLATALDLRVAELFSMCEKLAPIVDLVDTERGEVPDTHSRHKIITNSRTGLAMQIRGIIKANGYPWIADRFGDLVRRLIELPEFASVGHSMFMFDAINDVLSQGAGKGEGTGYKPVVRSLYESLQSSLSHSPDYWLQRAKAVLNIEDDELPILEGVDFAMKCYREAERERSIDNAEFLIALLYGKICWVTRYKKIGYITSAIQWFKRAIRNYSRNTNYVRTMLDHSRHRKNYFDMLCDHLEGPVSDVALLPLKKDVDYLISTRNVWKNLGVSG